MADAPTSVNEARRAQIFPTLERAESERLPRFGRQDACAGAEAPITVGEAETRRLLERARLEAGG